MNIQIDLPDEQATINLGALLARLLSGHGTVFLDGDLGSGKTTLARGLLRAMGHIGAVKSPTFTLVEPYEIGDYKIYHFDLYRLEDPEELEYIGFDDFFEGEPLCLIEWPEKGVGYLPESDLVIELSRQGAGRSACIKSMTVRGEFLVAELIKANAKVDFQT
ncbi:MAG: tRNA threonylcarbamoyladenosine biosynthesis protein TsaE [Candidatus Azotimanducaceae bacterium]|jgi:tRNA threonylcarbamoyladenosine biosynthesis protein TsaE